MTPEFALYGFPPSDAHEPRKSDLLEVLNTFAASESVNVKGFGAKGDGTTDDTDAIQAALATGGRVYFPKGDYVITRELEIVHAGQVVEFETTGGYGYGENIGLNWTPGTRLVSGGAFAKRIRTRRYYRASAADPQDPPLSVMINIQAEGVQLVNVCTWLTCDYTDASPTNFGHNVDVGIFVGCRVGVQLHNPQVIGYFRRAGVYLDVTGDENLPRFPTLAGGLYPDGTVKNGADGFHMFNPYIRGARQGFAVLGSLPEFGIDGTDSLGLVNYYDEQLGTTVLDTRGSFGCSDLCVFGGRIYGPDHHSNRRIYDPTGSGVALDPWSAPRDDEPCAVKIDGRAGNGSGNIWGMRFFGTRIATFEARRVQLERASRVSFIGCHIEGRNLNRMDTAGNVIDTNDYELYSYGDISTFSRLANRITLICSNRQSHADGAAVPAWFRDSETYQGPTLITDSGRNFVGDYLEVREIRGTQDELLTLRLGNETQIELAQSRTLFRAPYLSHEASMDLRAATGADLVLRSGSTVRLTAGPDKVSVNGANLQIGTGSTGPSILSGSGSPEGTVTAPPGSLYLRTTGKLWVKETGTGATGWVQK